MKQIKNFLQFNESRFTDVVLENKLNQHKISQFFKEQAKKKASEKAKEMAQVLIPEIEQKNILKAVKAKKYDVLGNMDKMQKLQTLGLVRSPKGVEIASSFSFPFYLTKKGENLITENIGSVNEDLCPICDEKFEMQCKCMTTNRKTLDDLKRGHGKSCSNGHRWTYDTPDGKVLTLDKTFETFVPKNVGGRDEELKKHREKNTLHFPFYTIYSGEILVDLKKVREIFTFIGEGVWDLDIDDNRITITFYEESYGGIELSDWNKADIILKKMQSDEGFDGYNIDTSHNRITIDLDEEDYSIGY